MGFRDKVLSEKRVSVAEEVLESSKGVLSEEGRQVWHKRHQGVEQRLEGIRDLAGEESRSALDQSLGFRNKVSCEQSITVLNQIVDLIHIIEQLLQVVQVVVAQQRVSLGQNIAQSVGVLLAEQSVGIGNQIPDGLRVLIGKKNTDVGVHRGSQGGGQILESVLKIREQAGVEETSDPLEEVTELAKDTSDTGAAAATGQVTEKTVDLVGEIRGRA